MPYFRHSAGPHASKHPQVPDSWLRGFLQVQSAPTPPRTSFELSPIDVYNLLRHPRLNADQKRKGRGLRVELMPGDAPRLVLEPWETVITASAGAYTGRKAGVTRIWGQRRLLLVRRLLPFVDSVQVHLLGTGLPSFWVLRAGPVTLTLSLSGFTAADWSRSVSFDLLLPRRLPGDDIGKGSTVTDQVIAHLQEHHRAISEKHIEEPVPNRGTW